MFILDINRESLSNYLHRIFVDFMYITILEVRQGTQLKTEKTAMPIIVAVLWIFFELMDIKVYTTDVLAFPSKDSRVRVFSLVKFNKCKSCPLNLSLFHAGIKQQ